MAAPSPTARQTPFGHRLKDGFKAFYTFAANPKLSVWEMEVTPPGEDIGDKINTTTMWNDTVVTYAAGQLIDFTDGSFVGAYDPKIVTQIIALMGVEQAITVTYSNGDTEAFFGYLKSRTPNSMTRNNMPTANFVVVCTNVDPVNDTEEVPVITLSGGT
jgi:hypothetical protein